VSYRSPLGHARGLGSAKDGTQHFWVQRVTAVALIPLVLWFVFGVACYGRGDYGAVHWWVHAPAVAITLILLIVTAAYHSKLGVQVVVEDYVGGEGKKITTLLLSNFVHLAAAAAAIFAVLKIAFTPG
jgi:succinate dehydrogenase / fumarate reductase membrane anchor subunit